MFDILPSMPDQWWEKKDFKKKKKENTFSDKKK